MTILLVVLSLAVSVGGGWLFVQGVLRLASRYQEPDENEAPMAGDDAAAPEASAPSASRESTSSVAAKGGPESPQARAALRGGTWIGILERLAVTGCILLGQPSGVAVVVAVKGLGRYSELVRNPSASERFVIGTLASLSWAAAIGFAGRAWL